MEITSQQGDILQVRADAIVSPSTSLGEMTRGAAHLLKEAGGQSIEDEAKEKGPIPVGEAVYTAAGSLPFKYIIHAPVVEEGHPVTIEGVRQAVVASLLCADSFGVRLLALPLLTTAQDSLAASRIAETVVETLRNYETASVRKVILIDPSADIAKAFRDALFAERS